jgi:2'-5' RNA ligase
MRIFLAIDIPQNLKKEIKKFISECYKIENRNIKYVEEENLHITLKFFGEVKKEKVKEIQNSFFRVKQPNFRLKLSKIGCFPDFNRAKVLWIGIEDSKELSNLFNLIEKQSINLGFKPEERDFKPHLTIARFKTQPNSNLINFLTDNIKKEFGEFCADRFILYESKLTPNGPIYSKIQEFFFEQGETNGGVQ